MDQGLDGLEEGDRLHQNEEHFLLAVEQPDLAIVGELVDERVRIEIFDQLISFGHVLTVVRISKFEISETELPTFARFSLENKRDEKVTNFSSGCKGRCDRILIRSPTIVGEWSSIFVVNKIFKMVYRSKWQPLEIMQQ